MSAPLSQRFGSDSGSQAEEYSGWTDPVGRQRGTGGPDLSNLAFHEGIPVGNDVAPSHCARPRGDSTSRR